MLNYYKEQLEQSKEQLRLAEIGYEQALKDCGEKLKTSTSIKESENAIDQLKKTREAIANLKSTVAYRQDRYDEEYNKPENVSARAKETLFGGKE